MLEIQNFVLNTVFGCSSLVLLSVVGKYRPRPSSPLYREPPWWIPIISRFTPRGRCATAAWWSEVHIITRVITSWRIWRITIWRYADEQLFSAVIVTDAKIYTSSKNELQTQCCVSWRQIKFVLAGSVEHGSASSPVSVQSHPPASPTTHETESKQVSTYIIIPFMRLVLLSRQ